MIDISCTGRSIWLGCGTAPARSRHVVILMPEHIQCKGDINILLAALLFNNRRVVRDFAFRPCVGVLRRVVGRPRVGPWHRMVALRGDDQPDKLNLVAGELRRQISESLIVRTAIIDRTDDQVDVRRIRVREFKPHILDKADMPRLQIGKGETS